jgi:cobalamin synthase
MTGRRALDGLRLAVSMFTVVPAGAVVVDRDSCGRALRWLPVVGAVLGAAAGGAAMLVWRGEGRGAPLLGAVLAVTVLALLTRGLHLDGLADLADGLGSRRPGPDALEIMRQSDVGPFGVATLVLSLLLQVCAVAVVLGSVSRPLGVVELSVATATGRLAILFAAAGAVPPARPDGFGALVAGSTGRTARAIGVLGLGAAGLLAASWAGADGRQLAWIAAAIVLALAGSTALRVHAVRRIGGVTGDVFGALVEASTTVCVVVLAAAASWA